MERKSNALAAPSISRDGWDRGRMRERSSNFPPVTLPWWLPRVDPWLSRLTVLATRCETPRERLLTLKHSSTIQQGENE